MLKSKVKIVPESSGHFDRELMGCRYRSCVLHGLGCASGAGTDENHLQVRGKIQLYQY